MDIQPASEADVEGILALVNGYAEQNLMLPRTPEQIRAALPKFLVARQAGRVVGCGSLVELTPALVEVRSLAVAPELSGQGLGGEIVGALVARAREAGYAQVCALVLREEFFNRLGFTTVDRWTISPKIWLECIYCQKFNHCDEIAVLMNLTAAAPALTPAEQASSNFANLPWREGIARRLARPVLACPGRPAQDRPGGMHP